MWHISMFLTFYYAFFWVNNLLVWPNIRTLPGNNWKKRKICHPLLELIICPFTPHLFSPFPMSDTVLPSFLPNEAARTGGCGTLCTLLHNLSNWAKVFRDWRVVWRNHSLSPNSQVCAECRFVFVPLTLPRWHTQLDAVGVGISCVTPLV